MRILFILLVLSLSGCASSTYTTGRDFSEAQVAQLKIGETTVDIAKEIFGEPYSSTVSASGERILVYTYVRSDASAQSLLFTTKVTSTVDSKTLTLTFVEDLLTDFASTVGGGPANGATMTVN